MFQFLYDIGGINTEAFVAINKLTNVSIVPYLLQMISLPFCIQCFAIYYFTLFILMCAKYKSISQERFDRYFESFAKSGITYALFGFSYAFLKFSINMPRPFCSLQISQFKTIADTTHERCLSSFPSAHTGLSIMIAYFLWPYLNNTLRAVAIIVVFLVCASRIALAMHYPSDILYSAVIIWGVIYFGLILYKAFQKNLISWFKTALFNPKY